MFNAKPKFVKFAPNSVVDQNTSTVLGTDSPKTPPNQSIVAFTPQAPKNTAYLPTPANFVKPHYYAPQEMVYQNGATGALTNTNGFGVVGQAINGTTTTTTQMGSAKVKYLAPMGKDYVVNYGQAVYVCTKHQCITGMKDYWDKSIEEIRQQDYTAGRGTKKTMMEQSNSSNTLNTTNNLLFGQKPNSFGAQQNQNQTLSSSSLSSFGQNSTADPFRQQQAAIFGNTITNTSTQLKSIFNNNIAMNIAEQNDGELNATTDFGCGGGGGVTAGTAFLGSTKPTFSFKASCLAESNKFQFGNLSRALGAQFSIPSNFGVGGGLANSWNMPMTVTGKNAPYGGLYGTSMSTMPIENNAAAQPEQQQSNVSVHEKVLSMINTPFGDDHVIFKNTVPEATPATIAPVTQDINYYYYGPRMKQNRYKPLKKRNNTSEFEEKSIRGERSATLFDSCDEYDDNVEFFSLNPATKRLNISAPNESEYRVEESNELQPSNSITELSAAGVAALSLNFDDLENKPNFESTLEFEPICTSSRLYVEKKSHPTGIIQTREDYYTIPSLDELISFVAADGSCVIPNFTIGRKAHGNVFFNEEFDVAGLDLDEIVHFGSRAIVIYPDDENKPPLGIGLNRPAQVTLDRIWPRDKLNDTVITDPDRLIGMNWEEKLRKVCCKSDTRFVDYRPETGSWVFCVKHF